MKIFLTGFMGCGKTELGNLLASKMNMAFYDTDQLIELKTGKAIKDIFSVDGESAFRKMEKEILQEVVLQNMNMVVATGGGTPCFNDNMDIMNKSGITIYLKYPANTLEKRLCHKTADRPLLAKQKNRKIKIAGMLAKREKYYCLSQIIITPDENETREKICEQIINSIKY
mgnify:CR=1 FL=1